MRQLVVLVVLAFAVPASAQVPAAYSPTQYAQPAAEQHKQPQQLTHKPSGFWTSPHDASDRPYRWGKMAIGGLVVVAMGLLMWRLVKKASAERARR